MMNVRDFFAGQCESSMPGVNLSEVCYSASRQRIVSEKFDYVQRPREVAIVVKSLQERCEERNRAPYLAADKRINPLIAVTAAPGCGKSAFLAHFPESEAYKTFVASCHTHTEGGAFVEPIVSAFTFNSGMEMTYRDQSHHLGLRILYGAMTSMSTPGSAVVTWTEFVRDFHARCGATELVTAREAVLTLQEVFGTHRRVLLLVDEISKASELHSGWDEKVMRELGDLLNNYGWVDVIVSSLSVNYIKELVATGSQRQVVYLALPVLLDAPLGVEEAHKWTETILAIAKSGLSPSDKIDPFVVNLLRNVFLLASGHPRSLEHLAKLLEVKDNIEDESNRKHTLQEFAHEWKDIITAVKNKMAVGALLVKLADKVVGLLSYQLSSADYFNDLIPMVLSCSAVDLSNRLARQMVENGEIYLVPDRSSKRLLAMVRFDNFAKLVRHAASDPNPSPYAKALSVLFKDIVIEKKTQRIGVFWERVVALTIVCRSITAPSYSILGLFPGMIALSAMQATESNDLNSKHEKVLVLTPPNHEGSDSWLIANECVAYLQVKIAQSAHAVSMAENILKIVSKTVALCIRDHLKYACTKDIPFEKVRIVLYVWAVVKEEMITKEQLSIAVQAFLDETRNKPNSLFHSMEEDSFADFCDKAHQFVSAHFSNIVLLGKNELDDWIIPSLRPIPRMVEAVGVEG